MVMWYAVSVVLSFIIVFLLISLERALRLKPNVGLSDLWLGSDSKPHLHGLSLPELHDEVQSRRRDANFDIHPGNHAQIHWHNGEHKKTKLAIVFVHGWTASPHEIIAVIKAMGNNLKANIYAARLSGHGAKTDRSPSGGNHLVHEALPERLYADAFDAAHIGMQLGDKLVFVGSSTGAALLTYVYLHAETELKSRVVAFVGVSPAYALKIPLYYQLGSLFAWFRTFLPVSVGRFLSKALLTVLAGRRRVFAAMNDEHNLRSTLSYPSEALLSCFEVIWEAYHLDFAQLDIPTMFVGCCQDKTINWEHTCGPRVFGKLPNAKTLLSVKPHDTEHQHVLGSHFLSPSYVQEIQKTMTAFVGHHAGFDGY